jgi:hypothetical protein
MDIAINKKNIQSEELRPAAYGRAASRMPKYVGKALEAARPLAYASEVGESFRKVFPKMVKPLYALSIAYVMGDIGIKYYNSLDKSWQYRRWYLADLSLWHLGASLLLPAVAINRYIHTLAWFLGKMKVSNRALLLLPTISALCLIPFIVHPLDHFTDSLMDASFRRYVNYKEYENSDATESDTIEH